jgi:dihydroorotase
VAEPILITGADIVNEGKSFKGSVLIRDDRIAGIFREPDELIPAGVLKESKILDASGKHLLPGVIDDQVHFRDPGLTEKGDLFTESRAAVAGGITSFMDMPNTNPKATTLSLLEEKFRLAGQKSLANYSFFLGATEDNLPEIEKADPARVCGLKIFLGASTGNMLVADPAVLEEIFKKSKLIVAIHSEDETIIRKNLAAFRERYGEAIPVEAHPLIRSEEACFVSTERAVNLAKKHGTRLHILHLSTGRELSLLEPSVPLGEKKITAEVCVHHLWFDDRDYSRLGSRIKWNPAIKTEADKNALLAGLLEDRIDIIATDHAPHSWQEKQNPYAGCPSGAPLVQHALPAMLELVRLGKIPLTRIVDKMCHSPAILYRIRGRGYIREGYFADLVLVDRNAPWQVEPSNILYKCGWSPFEGQRFSSSVTHTFVNGELAYGNGKVFDEVRGKRLEFERE